ncbi:radical SAM protein (TIGR01212 family) [Acetoanaerobium pronyense]|uniref:Radical SAM protein (TIGR01212 family) n=1 Tax=Acetoanaerobium pronyense TaxID=1482736 RepID=A0ABS4KHH3_9FIRM|nr:TIGR01212 family radical SAM protein [Acetoanaerobium pronyense]MBP2026820.1 radical SAM protein (TIGR01212 family) [Acetoanaerobium pronyense]
MWNDKRYHSLNYELKKIFGEKIIKLSIDGGFTCPTRDGTKDTKGCIFCSERGSGDFAGFSSTHIHEQMKEQINLLKNKWPNGKYIAYFQNFSNTYDDIERLRERYEKALEFENVVGLAIATRPDCISKEIVDYLSTLNKKTFLWVELGLQTSNDSTGEFIRRGYSSKDFDNAVDLLNNAQIRTVGHVILSLPGETKLDFENTIRQMTKKNIWGIKIHMLHILKNTDLYKYYLENPFPLLSQDEYVKLVCDLLEIIPNEVVIHRLTGDGPRELLHEPLWTGDKRRTLNSIDKELKKRNTLQGFRA